MVKILNFLQPWWRNSMKTLNFRLFWAISDGSKIQKFQGGASLTPLGGLQRPQYTSCLSRRLLRTLGDSPLCRRFLCADFIECHPCLLILAGCRTKRLPRQSNGVAWRIENHSHLTSGAWETWTLTLNNDGGAQSEKSRKTHLYRFPFLHRPIYPYPREACEPISTDV